MAEGGLSSNQSQESLNDCSGDPDSTSQVNETVLTCNENENEKK